MWSNRELIVAPATRPGSGCRSVVRLSGDGLEPLLRALFRADGQGFAGPGGPPRLVAATLAADGLGREWGGVKVDVLHWPGPAGPTGGPLAEVQLPASPPLAAALVAEACRLGARTARGGEFTLRAFLAGRLDLVQAEAVLAVVDATTPAELSAALDALAGGVGRELQGLRESLLDLAADMEAAIDFADETIPDAVPVADAAARAAIDLRMARHVTTIEGIAARLAGRDATAAAGLPRVVLAGPPNVGKSSLFNRLVGRDAALVADEPGTTRDWIAARLDVAAGEPACLLVDVAGVTADEPPTGRGVAAAADARARAEIGRAAVLLACRDARGPTRDVRGHRWPVGAVPRIDVVTRCDIEPSPGERDVNVTAPHDAAPYHVVDVDAVPDAAVSIRTSSRTGLGLAELREAILRAVAALPAAATPATARMQAALSDALAAVVAAREVGDEAVAAACIRRAVAAIDDVTGAALDSDLIDRVFSRHCIGK